MEERMVKVKIVSARGHDVLDLTVDDALSEIKRQARDNSKWIFMDDELVSDIDSLTHERVGNANSIMLSNQLVGG